MTSDETAACPSWHYLPGPYDASDCPNAGTHKAQRAAARNLRVIRGEPCTCSGPIRETVGMVCQECGTNYG